MINQYGLKSVSGCELYLIRLKKDGTVGTSKPCPSCVGLIDYFGIDKVYHTYVKGDKYESSSIPYITYAQAYT